MCCYVAVKKTCEGSCMFLKDKSMAVVTSYDINPSLNNNRIRYITFKRAEHFVCYLHAENNRLTMTSTATWPDLFREHKDNIQIMTTSENVVIKEGYISVEDVSNKKRGRPKKDGNPEKAKKAKLRSIDARRPDSSDDILEATVVNDNDGIPSSSRKVLKTGCASRSILFGNDVVPDCEFNDTIYSYIYVGQNSRVIQYKELTTRISKFHKTNYAMKALKLAMNETVSIERAKSRNKRAQHPLIFTSMSIEDGELYFNSIGFGYNSVGNNSYKAMKNAKLCFEPYKKAYHDTLDLYPYQLYAYFVCIGIFVEHVKGDVFPKYMGVEYKEECDDSDETWDIKSIRNMILHEPDDKTTVSIMLLIDWEMSSNAGEFAEEPNDKSVLSWTAFYNLKDYTMLTCYLKHRAMRISGANKDLTDFPDIDSTDEEMYLKSRDDIDKI